MDTAGLRDVASALREDGNFVSASRVEDAADEIDALRAEADRLQGWKSSAMTVLSEWDEVWEALDKPGPLGSSKAVSAKTEVERLRMALVDIIHTKRDDGAVQMALDMRDTAHRALKRVR